MYNPVYRYDYNPTSQFLRELYINSLIINLLITNNLFIETIKV